MAKALVQKVMLRRQNVRRSNSGKVVVDLHVTKDCGPEWEPVTTTTTEDQTSIAAWLNSRGWYYAGHSGGVFTYLPKYENSTYLVVDTVLAHREGWEG